MNRVLLVDDEKNILEAYERNMGDIFDITSADSGAAALKLIKESGPYRVIVSDYKMPRMNGVELLESVRIISPDTVQIMLTGQAEMQAVIDLINKGRIFRFLTKPCSTDDLVANINDAVRQYELVSAERELLGKTLGGSIKVLTDLLAITKPLAFDKTLRLRNIAKIIYSKTEMNNKWQVEIASMLSQIGCITIPDDILKKVYRGFLLSENENSIFQAHPSVGADMIKNIPRLDPVAEIIRYQEKNYNGSGFPADDISGEEIPAGARILKIAIDFDKLVKSGLSEESALMEMRKRAGFYDDVFFESVESSLLKSGDQCREFIQKELPPDYLKEGMFLGEDLLTASGITLASKNQPITQALITTIRNYARNHQIKEKIIVILVNE